MGIGAKAGASAAADGRGKISGMFRSVGVAVMPKGVEIEDIGCERRIGFGSS
jgi:hypothetical protein